jgi:peptidylprolyl isomerase
MYTFGIRFFLTLALVVNTAFAAAPDALLQQDQSVNKKGEQVIIQLKDGEVKIELYADKAPKHVERIKELANRGFYNGVVFHRVIDGFMAQTGDPTGTGMGGSELADLPAEFNDIKHVRGVVSMARSANPDSANSQFFIMFADAPHLDGQYTAFGKVVSGMEFVDKIKKGNPYSGQVDNPDKIIKMTVAE